MGKDTSIPEDQMYREEKKEREERKETVGGG